MPLYSDHISNMYYSGSSSYSAPYSYSSKTPLGTSYSASYLNPGSSYSNHSSLGGYSRAPVSSRWITSIGRNYSPMLSTISERVTSSPVRISSPRRIPISRRSFKSSNYTPRPININTADIDVSRNKYRPKAESPPPPPPAQPPAEAPSADNETGPFMPRVDGKPETGIDSSPGLQRSTIRRGRTVVRLHTIKRKERDSPRKSENTLESTETNTEENASNTDTTESKGWREKLSQDLIYVDKKEKKSLGAKLVEKFIVKDNNDSDSENTVSELRNKEQTPSTLCEPPTPPASTSKSPDRRCSMEILAEQANLLDSLIRGENLSTASLDLTKVGVSDESSTKDIKTNEYKNPLKTTKSDNSLYDRFRTSKDLKEPKHSTKRRSLKRSSSGGRLDSITEFPREAMCSALPAIAENKSSVKNENTKSKPKLKAKITSSVEVSPPASPLKFKIEEVTVEEKPRPLKKEITYSCTVDDNFDESPKSIDQSNKTITNALRKSKMRSIRKKPESDSNVPSPEPDDGNFWDKIGKRETVYLMKRKQFIEDSREQRRRALYWFPGDEESSGNEDVFEEANESNTVEHIDNKKLEDDEVGIENKVQNVDTTANAAVIVNSINKSDSIIPVEERLFVANVQNNSTEKLTESSAQFQLNTPLAAVDIKGDLQSPIKIENSTNKLTGCSNKSEMDKDNHKLEGGKECGLVPSDERKVEVLKTDKVETTTTMKDDIKQDKPDKNSKITIPETTPVKPENNSQKNKAPTENLTSNTKNIETVLMLSQTTSDKEKVSAIPEGTKLKNKIEVQRTPSPKSNTSLIKDDAVPTKDTNAKSVGYSKNQQSPKHKLNKQPEKSCPVHGKKDNPPDQSETNTEQSISQEKEISTGNKPDARKVQSSLEKKISTESMPDTKTTRSSLEKQSSSESKPDAKKVKSSLEKPLSSESKPDAKILKSSLEKQLSSESKPDAKIVKSSPEKQLSSECKPGAKKDITDLNPNASKKSAENDSLETKQEKIETIENVPDKQDNLTSEQKLPVIVPEIPIVIESVNIPKDETAVTTEEQKTTESIKAENKSETKEEEEPTQSIKEIVPTGVSKKPVKEELAVRPLIATPRPLQKKSPQVIHSSSSSESSSSEEDSSDEEDADESDASEGSAEFFECENNTDGRTSTGSNDSGFDSSAPTSPAGFVHIKKGGEIAGPSASAAPALGNTPNFHEQQLEQSTAYELFRKTGRFTPPARSIPRFKKYNIEDFHFVKVLGKGSFGKVLLAELKDTEYYYAVKCLKKDVVLEDDDVECTLIERKVLALGTNHPYLCHLFATFQTDSHLFFVMEYLNGGDLMFHIQQSGRFPEARARFYAAEIVSGLKFLHKRGIVYRDLKLDNILLDFDGHVRIADFGMCKLQIYLEKTADTFCGTPDYMAPEIIKGLKYNQTVDWWSFGVLLYEMLIGQSPFSGCDEDELFWSICNEMPSYPRFLTEDSLNILTRLLDKDARTRLGGTECMYGDVRDQDFFRPVHWDRLERRELDAPFKPKVRHPLDTQYFDRAFTGERPRLTAVEPQVLRSMDQQPFRGFSYTNPNATDR